MINLSLFEDALRQIPQTVQRNRSRKTTNGAENVPDVPRARAYLCLQTLQAERVTATQHGAGAFQTPLATAKRADEIFLGYSLRMIHGGLQTKIALFNQRDVGSA